MTDLTSLIMNLGMTLRFEFMNPHPFVESRFYFLDLYESGLNLNLLTNESLFRFIKTKVRIHRPYQ